MTLKDFKNITLNPNQVSNEIPIEINEILTQTSLFSNICDEFNKKVVGEELSCRVIFLCASGRLVINSSISSYNLLVNDDAGVGKDYIVNAVLSILPKWYYVKRTRISPTAFTYWHNSKFEPEWTWNGKIFYAEDISEGVLNSDVFKVMCSSGSTASVVINQKTIDIEIDGKPVIITTTATATPNPELVRRFVILSLDSSQNQTEAILKRHSEYARSGIVPEYNELIIDSFQYLERVKVKIPFADNIARYFPTKSIIMRTNYPRFLDFIRSATALYQFQREKDLEDFLLATGQDYNIARECFLRLFSNKYMIPLTINQKKILSFFENVPELKGSISQLHGKYMNWITDKGLGHNLRLLSNYGLLEVSVEKDSMNRDMEVYSLSKSFSPNQKIELPTYEELCQNASISSLSTIPTLSSLSTLSRDSEDTEDREALNRPPTNSNWGSLKVLFKHNPELYEVDLIANAVCSEEELSKWKLEGLIYSSKTGFIRRID